MGSSGAYEILGCIRAGELTEKTDGTAGEDHVISRTAEQDLERARATIASLQTQLDRMKTVQGNVTGVYSTNNIQLGLHGKLYHIHRG